jgi:Glycosyl transferases group 1
MTAALRLPPIKPISVSLSAGVSCPMLPNRKLLLLAMPGRFNRHWIFGMANCARRAGMDPVVIETDAITRMVRQDARMAIAQLNLLVQQKIGAVVSYCHNGVIDLPTDCEGSFRSFWEIRGIPHLAIWADHPQWAFNQQNLQADLQPAFRSGNLHHFLKNAAHAWEMRRMMGWPNCYELPMAVDPDQLTPATDIEPEFDLVAIYSDQAPTLPDWCRPFLDQANPDPLEMIVIAGKRVSADLAALWESETPAELRKQLLKLGERLIEYRISDPLAASARHLPQLEAEFPIAFWWLAAHPRTWFKASQLLYAVRGWQRTFTLAYLARFMKVAVFGGGDWSHLGIHSEPGWIQFADIPRTIARGRVAINIMPGHDEEGATPKTFELAASARPLVHGESRGIEDLFDAGTEIALFATPAEARHCVETLLSSPHQRSQMGQAARLAIESRHNWQNRLRTMFATVGIAPESFGLSRQ